MGRKLRAVAREPGPTRLHVSLLVVTLQVVLALIGAQAPGPELVRVPFQLAAVVTIIWLGSWLRRYRARPY
jgi:hypothetical protein